MKKVKSPNKVIVTYESDGINKTFDEVIEQYLSYLDLKLVGSGYHLIKQQRDLEFVIQSLKEEKV